jgi:phage gp36-like protein
VSTPISNAAAYATSADFVARFDIRDVAQWVSDTGSPVSQASITTTPFNANLLAALADASGMVESACFVSDRYTPNDLTILNGNSLALLKRIVCGLAVGMLIERRPFLDREPPKVYEQALEWLDRLRKGERIFALQEAGDAGNPLVTFTSQADLALRNPVSVQMYRFFGDRGQYFVPGTQSTVVGDED